MRERSFSFKPKDTSTHKTYIRISPIWIVTDHLGIIHDNLTKFIK